METEKGTRRLNPSTIALIRKAMAEHAPVDAIAAKAVDEPLAPRPLALIPFGAQAALLTQNAVAKRPVAPRTPRSSVGVGATPLLPGLGLNPAAVPKPPPVKKSAIHGDFARLSAPDAPLTDVVIVDTETTGAGHDARLVELGALHVRDGKVVAQFQTLVDPEEPIPPYVVRIHGITNAMVRGQPKAKVVLPAFLAFVGARCLLAHNAAFDRNIIANEMIRAGMKRPDVPMFCSLKLARKVFPQAPNHKLSTLASYLKIPDPPSHRAIADCMTTVGVLVACASRHPLRTLHLVHGGAVPL